MSRYVLCPPPCGAKLHRRDTRRAHKSLHKILRIRLYQCENGHEIETSEVIVGEVRAARRHDKQIIYSHSVRREGRRDDLDYLL